MNDERKKRSWAWIGWAALALFVLYPLSFGPTIRLAFQSSDPETNVIAVGRFYAPLGWLCKHSTAAGAVMDWYWGLWEPPGE